MTGCGPGIGVIVIAIREHRPMVEKHTEAAGAELVGVALHVVAAELVDDDDHDQFGASVINGSLG